MEGEQYLPPEPQSGNVEYKFKLIKPTKQKFEHLVTQLKWRLNEGTDEAIYEIGVKDNGRLVGINQEDMDETLRILRKMASSLHASSTVTKTTLLKNGYVSATVLIKKRPQEQTDIEVRVAVLGSAGAGKSTLLGVLTRGVLDNGKGMARLNMFRHLHEIKSGRTSSISEGIVGFDAVGNVNNYIDFVKVEEICKTSSKLVTFLDLAGHKKYRRTTIQGLLTSMPHYVMLVISSLSPVSTSLDYVNLIVALDIPFFIVFTKFDIYTHPKQICCDLLLKQSGCDQKPIQMNNVSDFENKGGMLFDEKMVPVFTISSVTGIGLDILLKFLYTLTQDHYLTDTKPGMCEQQNAEFRIEENLNLSDIGQIFCGIVMKGTLLEKSGLQIGPMTDGSFQKVAIHSIHRNGMPCGSVVAGQRAAVRLDRCVSKIRKGMVLLDENVDPKLSFLFRASIFLLNCTNWIKPGCQVAVLIANIRQTATILKVTKFPNNECNQRYSVVLKFRACSEYITIGQSVFISNGNCKGTGRVIEILSLD